MGAILLLNLEGLIANDQFHALWKFNFLYLTRMAGIMQNKIAVKKNFTFTLN